LNENDEQSQAAVKRLLSDFTVRYSFAPAQEGAT
jgi:hypothetical protein